MSYKAVTPASTAQDAASSYEDTYVHTIYNSIAHHFSATRYKPWPVVAVFLDSIPPGHIGLDAGCGNGKYLIAPKDREGTRWTIGLDRSEKLLEIAKNAGGRSRECVLGDVLDTPWRAGAFDYAVSIATIHHLSTPERRKKSVQSLLKCLSPSHGRGLIYVWAVLQDELSKRSIPRANSTQELRQEAKGQDVFVPWVSPEKVIAAGSTDAPAVFNRYYHMFEEGELRELVVTAASEMGISEGSPASRRDVMPRHRCLHDFHERLPPGLNQLSIITRQSGNF